MATKALTRVAQRASRVRVSVQKSPGNERDWRQVIHSGDAEAIWHKLALLVRKAAKPTGRDHGALTQEIFLHLLATERFHTYLEDDLTDEEIHSDLLETVLGVGC